MRNPADLDDGFAHADFPLFDELEHRAAAMADDPAGGRIGEMGGQNDGPPIREALDEMPPGCETCLGVRVDMHMERRVLDLGGVMEDIAGEDGVLMRVAAALGVDHHVTRCVAGETFEPDPVTDLALDQMAGTNQFGLA
jgi:hypothetical protein